MRTSTILRKTAETDISLTIELDGNGTYDIDTGVGFLNHMLELFAKHGNFNLTVKCNGDLQVDAHHTTEDVAICLGRALREAAGDCRGIYRYGDIILPMDETLILCAVDFSGRAYLSYDVLMLTEKVGDFDSELAEEFMSSLTREALMNLHLMKLHGTNTHHIIEGCFKALARTLRKALAIDPTAVDSLPSTKGVLS